MYFNRVTLIFVLFASMLLNGCGGDAAAPEAFKYDLSDISALPDLSNSDFVAITNGSAFVTNGEAGYSIPISVPPGINNAVPNLSIRYNSNAGDGLAGKGWALAGLPKIARCGSNLANDSFKNEFGKQNLCLDGERLIETQESIENSIKVYKKERDDFSRVAVIERVEATIYPSYFVLYNKDGSRLTFGGNDALQKSRAFWQHPRPEIWGLSRFEDRYGNGFDVYYDRDDAEVNQGHDDLRPISIVYDPGTAIKINYDKRNGHIPWHYDDGRVSKFPHIISDIRTYIDVVDVDLIESATLVKAYKLDYDVSERTYRDVLQSFTECGYQNGVELCSKPLVFDYTDGDFGFESSGSELAFCGGGKIPNLIEGNENGGDLINIDVVDDINQDGYNDLVAGMNTYWGTDKNCYSEDTRSTVSGLNYEQDIKQFESELVTPWGNMLAYRTNADEMIAMTVVGEKRFSIISSKGSCSHTNEQFCGVVFQDFDRDGYSDLLIQSTLLIQSQIKDSVGNFSIGSSELFMQLRNGLRSFDISLGGQYGGQYGVFGLNSSGYPDLSRLTLDYPLIGDSLGVGEQGNSSLSVYHGVRSIVDSTLNFKVSGTTAFEFSALGMKFQRAGAGLFTSIDLNGDGFRDIIYHRKDLEGDAGLWRFRLNSGGGPYTPGLSIDEIVTNLSSGGYNNQYSYAYDYNKDGIEEFLALPSGGGCSPAVYFARRSLNDIIFEEIASSVKGVGQACLRWASDTAANPFFGDFNNDGLVDLLYGQSGSEAYVRYAKKGTPDLLMSVTNGFGAKTSFQYSELSDKATIIYENGVSEVVDLYTPTPATYPVVQGDRKQNVVTMLSTSDGVGGVNHTTYQYKGLKFHARGRGNLGFEQIVAVSHAKGIKSTSTFYQDYPLVGELKKSIVEDKAGNLISIKDFQYAIHEENPEFHYPFIAIEKQYDLVTQNEQYPLSVLKTVTSFDKYGTLTQTVKSVGTGYYGDGTSANITGLLSTQTVVNENIDHYVSDDWLLGFIGKTTISTTSAGDSRSYVTERMAHSISGRPTNDVYQSHKLVGTEVWSKTITSRNSRGVITQVEQQAADIDGGQVTPRIDRIEFGSGEYLYPSNAVNSKQHKIQFIQYDKRFGVASEILDANALPTSIVFDPLGRKDSTENADGTKTLVKRFYCESAPIFCPSGAVYLTAVEVTNPNVPAFLGAPLVVKFHDALGRPVREQTWRFNGDVVKIDTAYNAQGYVARKSEPYTGKTPEYWTAYNSYDALGRPHSLVAPDQGIVTTNYEMDGDLYKTRKTVLIHTPEGTRAQLHQTWIDAQGLLVKAEDSSQGSVDYTYWPGGLLKSTVVNNREDTRIDINYDLAGNKSWMSDPDVGVVSFKYNGFGELRRQIWGAGAASKSIEWQYDVLGRKVTRMDTPTSGAPIQYAWLWDKDEGGTNKLFGAMSSRYGNGMRETYAYDALGRLKESQTDIDGLGVRKFIYGYDKFSRQTVVTYPDGLSVQTRYHASGEPVQIQNMANSKVLWALGDKVDSRGQYTDTIYGNGVVTKKEFQASNGRISSIVTGHLSDTNNYSSLHGNIQNLDYEFDTLGNLYSRISARTNESGSSTEFLQDNFTYDDLNRVRTAATYGLVSGERTETFNYDDLGNLRSKSGVGTLRYEQINNAGVHAVTSALGKSYQYDDFGNIVQRGSETLEYDVFNKPTRIGNAVFKYGPDHKRFKQVNGAKTTFYIGPYQEIIEGSQVVQRSTVGNFLVNNTVNGQSQLSYLHLDHIGSTDAITNELGERIESLSFDPWGKRRKNDWTTGVPSLTLLDTITTLGFTGHEQLDDSQLIHMNGRVYDPVIGRFLSPDLLIQDPTNTQSFNRYSYVLNNPLSFVDPSGYVSKDYGSTYDAYSTMKAQEEAAAARRAKEAEECARSQTCSVVMGHRSGSDSHVMNQNDFWMMTNQMMRESYAVGQNSGAYNGQGAGIWKQFNNMLSSLKVTQFGRTGGGGAFIPIGGGEVSYGYGISIDWSDLGNSKLYFQISDALGVGVGLGAYATQGGVAGLSDSQFESGLSEATTGTAFGFVTASLDFAGPAASGSIDFSGNGASASGWKMLRAERGLGFGGGGAIGIRSTITYATFSVNDVVNYFRD